MRATKMPAATTTHATTRSAGANAFFAATNVSAAATRPHTANAPSSIQMAGTSSAADDQMLRMASSPAICTPKPTVPTATPASVSASATVLAPFGRPTWAKPTVQKPSTVPPASI